MKRHEVIFSVSLVVIFMLLMCWRDRNLCFCYLYMRFANVLSTLNLRILEVIGPIKFDELCSYWLCCFEVG